jgi:hypothetical protein
LFPVEWLVEYSWEAHLWGALAGVVVAVVFRKDGPQKPPPLEDDEIEEEEGEDRTSYWHINTTK